MSDSIIPYQIKTYGCKVNTYDSGLIEKRFERSGYLNTKNAKVFVLNSCAVTAEATKEVLRDARKIKAKNPDSVVVVTGCSAQVDTEKFVDESYIDLVVANSHKAELENLIKQKLSGTELPRIHKSNIFKKDDFESGGGVEEAHTRSFLKIQDGCNSFCTFCVIPFARGKSRSLKIEDLRARVQELLAQGSREIVLTGVHIGDYEFGLENLIEDLLLHTRVPRLRLTSLEPIELNERLFELYTDPRMCPHFHMSIQSASTSVLEKMKRKYTAEQVVGALESIHKRVPSAFVGIDVIAGFPGEGETEFLDTYQRLSNSPWTRLHVFPYSERPGTYALKLDGKNDRSVILRRSDRLRDLSDERYIKEAKSQIGLQKKALSLHNGTLLTRDYWSVVCEESILPNVEYKIKVADIDPASLNSRGSAGLRFKANLLPSETDTYTGIHG